MAVQIGGLTLALTLVYTGAFLHMLSIKNTFKLSTCVVWCYMPLPISLSNSIEKRKTPGLCFCTGVGSCNAPLRFWSTWILWGQVKAHIVFVMLQPLCTLAIFHGSNLQHEPALFDSDSCVAKHKCATGPREWSSRCGFLTDSSVCYQIVMVQQTLSSAKNLICFLITFAQHLRLKFVLDKANYRGRCTTADFQSNPLMFPDCTENCCISSICFWINQISAVKILWELVGDLRYATAQITTSCEPLALSHSLLLCLVIAGVILTDLHSLTWLVSFKFG